MFRDLLHAFRVHGRSASHAAAVVLTLALGIGAVTSIFSLINAVLLESLGYPESERLVEVRQTYASLRDSPNPRLQKIWNRIPVSYQNASEWREENRTLLGLGLYAEQSVTLEGVGDPKAIDAAAIDADLLEVLGIEPILGRSFTAEEVAAREPLVLLGFGYWQKYWGGEESVLGSKLKLDGEPYSVVGVMPEGFEIVGGNEDRLWTPLRLEDADLERRNNQRLLSIARLADGVELSRAAEDLDRLARAQAEAWPETNEGAGVAIQSLRDLLVGKESRSLLDVLIAAVAMVLILACVNVAHLLMAQAQRRQGEWALRRALGAGRARLARQVLVEGLVLAIFGGALGLLLAVLGRHLLLAWLPIELPRGTEIPIDGGVLLFALGASVLTAILCSLPSAFTSATLGGRGEGGAPNVSERRTFPFHDALVVAEIAACLMLTSAAALLGHSFLRLASVDPGFEVEGILVQDIRLPAWSYPEEQRRQSFAEELVERLEGLPDVQSVGLTSKLPFAGPALVGGFEIPGMEATEEDWTQGPSASLKFVTTEYFQTLGIELKEGRGFLSRDNPDSGRVVVINETLAGRGWPDGNPTDRALTFSDKEYRIVGVAADIRHSGLAEPPGPLIYFPWNHRFDLPVMADQLTAVVETEGDPLALAAQLRAVVGEIDPSLPLPAATSIAAMMRDSLAVPRSRAALVGLLAGLALILALVGTYAVMAFSVGRRTREIGIRMALGASVPRVLEQVLGRTLLLTLVGVVLGLVGAIAGGRLLEGLLFGVEARDAATLALSATLLAVVALAAGFLPARRASRVDPVVALREE